MFPKYPYLDLSDRNLDFLTKAIREMQDEVKNFVSLNAVKYANPIQWSINRQYEKNTIVIDPLTGTAFISVQPVPNGVALTRTQYWTPVFDLSQFVTKAASNFANSYERDITTTATMPTGAGDWVVWNSTLYVALTSIHAGDAYVVNGNIKRMTVEDFYDLLMQAIHSLDEEIDTEIRNRTNADYALGDRIDAEIQNRADADDALGDRIDVEIQNRADADDALGDRIDAEIQNRADADDALDDHIMSNANKIGTLINLNTSDKSNLVAAINETNKRNKERTEDMFNVKSLNLDWSQDITAEIEALFPTHKRLYFPEGEYNLSLTIVHSDIEIFGDGFYNSTVFHPTTDACITLDARNGVDCSNFRLHDLSIVGSDKTKDGIRALGNYDTDPINNVVIKDVYVGGCRFAMNWKARGIWCIFEHVWLCSSGTGLWVQPPNDCAFNHNNFVDCVFGENDQYGIYMISTNAYRNNTIKFDHCNIQNNWLSNRDTVDVTNGFIYCNGLEFDNCYFEGDFGVTELYLSHSNVTINSGVSILPNNNFIGLSDIDSYAFITGFYGYGASTKNITNSGALNNHCVVIGSVNAGYQMNGATVLY